MATICQGRVPQSPEATIACHHRGEAIMLAVLGRFLAYLFTPITLFFRFLFITVASLVLVLSAGAGWFIMLTTFLCYCWAILLVGFGWLDWTSDPSLPGRVQRAGLLVLLGTLLFACGRFFVWIGVKKLSPVIGLMRRAAATCMSQTLGLGQPRRPPRIHYPQQDWALYTTPESSTASPA